MSTDQKRKRCQGSLLDSPGAPWGPWFLLASLAPLAPEAPGSSKLRWLPWLLLAPRGSLGVLATPWEPLVPPSFPGSPGALGSSWLPWLILALIPKINVSRFVSAAKAMHRYLHKELSEGLRIRET